MNVKTGQRTGVLESSEKKSELSSIDSALLMGGINSPSGISRRTPKSTSWRPAFTSAWTSSGCSMAIHRCSRTAGRRKQDS